jgi:hypothetical protein
MAGHVGGYVAGKEDHWALQLADIAASSYRHPPRPALKLNESSVISV